MATAAQLAERDLCITFVLISEVSVRIPPTHTHTYLTKNRMQRKRHYLILPTLTLCQKLTRKLQYFPHSYHQTEQPLHKLQQQQKLARMRRRRSPWTAGGTRRRGRGRGAGRAAIGPERGSRETTPINMAEVRLVEKSLGEE